MDRFLVTGSSGHLGEALVRTLRSSDGCEVVGFDIVASPWTTVVGSVTDQAAVRSAMDGVTHVLHTATLHKPHVGSHPRQAFIDVNVTGTLSVLECAAEAGVGSVVVTSSTSAFGRALRPPPGSPAVWITEDVAPVVRNVYGATKTAAEDLCELAAADGLPVVVLRTSRFFPEGDDSDDARTAYDDTNLKLVELTYRRVDITDVVDAHLCAARRAPALGFGRYIVSATTPFTRDDLTELGRDAPAVLARRCPDVAAFLADRGWRMLSALDRVYVNDRARADLHWEPRTDVRTAVDRIRSTGDLRSPLALAVGAKGYHAEPTGVYTR